ncbi:MAG: hypothetical protein K9K67_11845 [Bacteriovoracaceae bacterium]|nr:hypothetical protein [Bacteriovoracaceae bacterium]
MTKFLLRTIFTYFLVVLLVDGTNPFVAPFVIKSAFAAEGDAPSFEHLNSQYLGLRTRTNQGVPDHEGIANELAGANGETMLNQGQAFIANPQNRTQLATPEGQNFLNMHNKFARLRKLKLKLDSCFASEEYKELNNPQYTQAIPERIFAAAMTMPDDSIPCDPGFFNAQSLNELFGGVSDVIDEATTVERVDTLNQLQEVISEKNLDNAVESIVGLDFTYSGANLSDGAPLDQAKLDAIVHNICVLNAPNNRGTIINNRDRCTDAQKTRLKRVAKKKQERMIAEGVIPMSLTSAANDLKNKFTELNVKIVSDPSFQLDVTDGIISDSVNLESEKSQTAYSNYVNSYMNIIRTHPGMLALTETIGDDLGGRRDQDGRFLGIFGSGGIDYEERRFQTHNVAHLDTSRDDSTGVETVERAIRESKQKVMAQANRVFNGEAYRRGDMSSYDPNAWAISLSNNPDDIVENREASLKEIIKSNPVSVGQALMEKPGLASEACRIMRDIAKEQKENADSAGDWVTWRNVLLVGGLALGGIAVVGLGALIIGGGLALATGGVGAGVAAWGGATLSSIALPGLVYGVVETTDATYRWRQAAQERDALIESYMAGAGDDATVTEFFRAQEAAYNAAWEAGLAAGFTLLDAPAIMRVASLMDGAQSLRYFKRVKDIFKQIEADPKLIRTLRNLRRSLGADKVSQVMKEITKLDEGLDYIKEIQKLNFEEAENLFTNAHRICQRSCLGN